MQDLRQSTAAVNAKANAVAALLDDGHLRIYGGDRPATPDDAVTDQTLLAELRFGSPAFGPAEDGTITAHPLTSATAGASGTPTWYRALGSDGESAVEDGSVGPFEADLLLLDIQATNIVSVSDFTHTEPKSQ